MCEPCVMCAAHGDKAAVVVDRLVVGFIDSSLELKHVQSSRSIGNSEAQHLQTSQHIENGSPLQDSRRRRKGGGKE